MFASVALLEQPRRKHRIDVGAERPLKSLPLRQSGLHTVERCRERAEIVVLNHRQALAVVAGRNTFRSFGKILNWFQGRREGGEYRCRHTESQGQPESDHDPKRGNLTRPVEHSGEHRARDSKCKRHPQHGQVRPGGERGARPRQGVSDSRATSERDPYRPRGCLQYAVHPDQVAGRPENGAQDPILAKPRSGRAGNDTDNDRQHAAHDCGDP